MATKWVYMFTEGNATMRNLLGGKRRKPCRNDKSGTPGTTGIHSYKQKLVHSITKMAERSMIEIMAQIMDAIVKLEEITGKKFEIKKIRLLVSVRSGARASMPGMMDTILNLGLNEEVVEHSGRGDLEMHAGLGTCLQKIHSDVF